MIDSLLVSSIIQPRKKFSHKGDYGHVALIAGSKGMMGAAVLSARACMRSGAGKLTCHIPEAGYTIMQVCVPEAMAATEGQEHIEKIKELKDYDAVGIGPGLGQHGSNVSLLLQVFNQYRKPLIIDADALNTLARNKELLNELPPGSILTPHAKEFERLFGTKDNQQNTAMQKAAELNIIIVLKGADTLIATPGGKIYFNSTGNPGMATGGTGDALTGILTGLLGQGYTPEQTAVAAVYLHGLAGDLAAEKLSQPAMTASDLIDHLGAAFLTLHNKINTHPQSL